MINSKEKIQQIEQSGYFPICNNCKNHIKGNSCNAFATIPNEIIFGENNHSKPLETQKNDIVFEPIKNKNE